MSTGIPENTFASFDLALEHGCDGFEFDVRLTACGSAVVCHDPKVGKLTLARARAKQLPQLPRLNEVIQRYGERAFLNIELKVKDLESKVLTALGEFPPRQGYVVSSFIPDVVMELEARSSTVSIGIICETSGPTCPLAPASGRLRDSSPIAGEPVAGARNSAVPASESSCGL